MCLQRAELVKLRDRSKDAVITFSSSDFDKYAVKTGRDYHLVFFINANYLANNAQMKLPALRNEYGLTAAVSELLLQMLVRARFKAMHRPPHPHTL